MKDRELGSKQKFDETRHCWQCGQLDATVSLIESHFLPKISRIISLTQQRRLINNGDISHHKMPSQTESGTRFAENESFPNEEDPLIAPSQASNADGPTADPRDELKEPSNAKLAVILGSVWIGVVFTALGELPVLLIPIPNLCLD